jgi:hypothetical protein
VEDAERERDWECWCRYGRRPAVPVACAGCRRASGGVSTERCCGGDGWRLRGFRKTQDLQRLRNLFLRPSLRRTVETPQTMCADLQRPTPAGRLRSGDAFTILSDLGRRPSRTSWIQPSCRWWTAPAEAGFIRRRPGQGCPGPTDSTPGTGSSWCSRSGK